MDALIGAAGALVAAAVTPGPNNFVVMRAAVRGGLAAALPAIAGIVLGSLALLAVVAAGAGAAFQAEPRLQVALAVAGCLYLVYLGIRLLAGGSGDEPEELPAGLGGLFGFQFLNPKSWVLVLTVTAAAPAGPGPLAAFARLAPLFVVIPAVCLLLWAALGSVLARHLERPALRLALDRTLGALLVASALLLLTSIWPL